MRSFINSNINFQANMPISFSPNISFLDKKENRSECLLKNSTKHLSNLGTIFTLCLQELQQKANEISMNKYPMKFLLNQSSHESVSKFQISSSLFKSKTGQGNKAKETPEEFCEKNVKIPAKHFDEVKEESSGMKFGRKDLQSLISSLEERKSSQLENIDDYLERKLNNEFFTSISFKSSSEILINSNYEFPEERFKELELLKKKRYQEAKEMKSTEDIVVPHFDVKYSEFESNVFLDEDKCLRILKEEKRKLKQKAFKREKKLEFNNIIDAVYNRKSYEASLDCKFFFYVDSSDGFVSDEDKTCKEISFRFFECIAYESNDLSRINFGKNPLKHFKSLHSLYELRLEETQNSTVPKSKTYFQLQQIEYAMRRLINNISQYSYFNKNCKGKEFIKYR